MPNYNDPYLDFSLQDQLLKSQLLRGQAMQNNESQTYRGNNQFVAKYTPGADIANVLNKFTGGRQEQRATQGLKDLSAEQLRRIEGLNQELNSPQNVNWADPQAAQTENSRRSDVVSKMQQLPMAAESANRMAERMQQFPEVMMKQQDAAAARKEQEQLRAAARLEQQQYRDEAAAQRNADSIASREMMAANNNALRMTLGAMSQQGRNDKVSAAERKDELKRAAGFSKEQKTYTTTMNNLGRMGADLDEFMEGGGADAIGGYWAGSAANTVGALPFAPEYSKGVNQLENIKAKSMALGRELQNASGKIGPMAVQEWSIMQKTISALDPKTPDFKERMREVELAIKNMVDVVQTGYAEEAGLVGREDTLINFDELKTSNRQFMNQDRKGAQKPPAIAPVQAAPVTVVETKNGISLMSDGTYQEAQ